MPKETENNIIKKSVIEAREPFANSIQKDFQKVHKRLDSMDERLDGMDGKLDTMDGRLYAVEERLTNVERDVQWMKENSSALFTPTSNLCNYHN